MKIQPKRRTGRIVAILFGLLAVPPAMWLLGQRIYALLDSAGVLGADGWFGTFVNADNLIYVLPALLLCWWILKALAWAVTAAQRFVRELLAAKPQIVDKPSRRG